MTVDLRLDQSPGVWITAAGTLPLCAVQPRAAGSADRRRRSSRARIGLGLVEGVTDVVRERHGRAGRRTSTAIGTSRDPHFDGTIEIANAGFLVTATGASYKNGRAALTPRRPIASPSSRCTSRTAAAGRSTCTGSLGTHELRVGDLEIDVTARRFEVLRNEFGSIDVDATLRLRGRFENRRGSRGDVTISSGELKVDEILERTLFQPYSTQETAITEVDAVVALNPWERLGLDIALHVPDTLRLTGENVQVSPGRRSASATSTCASLGDLYLYKDPGRAALRHRLVRLGQRHLRVPGAPLRRRSRRARSTSAAT